MKVKRKKKVRSGRILKRKPNIKVLKKFALALAIVLIGTIAYVRYLQPHTLEAKQVLKLQSTQQQLQKTKLQLEQQHTTTQAEQTKQQQQIDQLNQQLQDAQKQLQAKRDSAIVYAAALPSVGTLTAGTYHGSGDQYMDYIISRESGGCPTKWQGETSCPSSFSHIYSGDETDPSRGYGLCQSTPAIKMSSAGDDWRTNPDTQIAWCKQYAINRYGSTYSAYVYWTIHHNW